VVFTSFNAKQAIRLTLVVVAAASMAACQTKPKPSPTTPPGPSTPGTQTGPTTPGGREPVAQGPLPGSAQDFVVNVGDRVYFDYDSYAIRDDARPVLEGQAAWLVRYPSVQVRIEGNADERGTREYNLALGARRANSVREFLTGRGVQAGRIATISNGKERPVDPGTSEDAYQRNRNGQTVVTGGAR
jgi:peptidoglycan-associated lipoprotein